MRRKSSFDRKLERLTAQAIKDSLAYIERILAAKYRTPNQDPTNGR